MSSRILNIMLIEDDALCLASLDRALRLNGFRTQGYTRPLPALADYDAQKIDAVVTDFHLPDVNGLEVLEKIRKINPEAVIILISGDLTQELPLQALDRGARAFFSKPLDIAGLMEKLNTAIRES